MSQRTEEHLPVAGLRLAAVAAGIRYRDRDDLVVMELAAGSTCASVFTRNAFCAAPVIVAREHLAASAPRYFLINAGNANAGTGEQGLRAARETCGYLAAAAGCAVSEVVPFSTGVIGEHLPVDRFAAALPGALQRLDAGGWPAAARAIMTTDTVPKLVSRRVEIGGAAVNVTGIAKGAGMICPDMATMLAFLATDAVVSRAVLQQCLERAVAGSFNAITVDGDTSTNDACALVATGSSGVVVDGLESDAGQALFDAVSAVCFSLARAIVQDAEGATKVVTVAVDGAGSETEARRVAYSIAHSPLVKTALFASDPNWGRILAAVGRAGVEGLDISRVTIHLDDVPIVSGGGRDAGYTEAAGRSVLVKPEYTIRVGLGRGSASASVLTCDLSFEYVRINAEYRT